MNNFRKINAIIDLQYGSTGKGLIAGYLAQRTQPDTIVTAWAANAGHTYIDGNGRKFIHTMLANGIVSPKLENVLIGPGSLINPDALFDELTQCLDLAGNAAVLIHPHAAIIQQHHIDEEQGPMTKIGSTKKGVGAAACERIRRDPDRNNVACNALEQMGHPLARHVCSVAEYNAALDASRVLQVEGAQGYSLSMYHGMYPYTTSRDVTTAQLFADCGIPADWIRDTTVIGTARTYPIRVANRYDDAGKQVGYSGGCYDDQIELQWSCLGREAELTTVTKLPRRIFTFSRTQLNEAIRACGVDAMFLNFMNYCQTEKELGLMLDTVSEAMYNRSGHLDMYLGFGPADGDVMHIRDWFFERAGAMDAITARWNSTKLVAAK